jgi:lysophospholipase L1-like esterase
MPESPSASVAEIDPATPFADEIRAFIHDNARLGAASDSIVFFGSSSLRLWESLGRDFQGIRVINRGFGGSTLADAAREFERVVAPLRPRGLVVYAGDNDLDNGGSPEQVLWSFESLVGSVRARLGGIPLLFLSIKPSPIRFWNNHQIRRANELLRDTCSRRGILFVDVYSRMLNEHGTPRRELFGEDGLHMSAAGYALWTGMLRPLLPSAG